MDPKHPAPSSMEWFKEERNKTDAQEQRLRKAADAEGTKGVMVESAILNAQSNRELVAGTVSAAETIAFSLELLRGQLGESSREATQGAEGLTKWTRQLVFATWVLAATALIASGVAAYIAIKVPPQTIVVPQPVSR